MKKNRRRTQVWILAIWMLWLLPLSGLGIGSASWAREEFRPGFVSSGVPGHPYIQGTIGGKTTWFYCMNPGASAHSNYTYYKEDRDVDYWNGSLEEKRLFWAYIGAWGSYDKNESLTKMFGNGCTPSQGKEVSWSKGKESGGSSWVEQMANDGFLSLQNIPPGCKSPEDIFQLISRYDSPERAMWTGNLYGAGGPASIDGNKLFDLCGITDWETFIRYCTITCINNPAVEVKMDPSDPMVTYTMPVHEVGAAKNLVFKVSYDPAVFRVLEVTGTLEFFRCEVSGSQQLYRAKGNVKESTCEFYLTTGYNPDAPSVPGEEGPVSDHEEIHVEVYQHNETFESNYKVDLVKKDYETGHPLEGSVWQVLERFEEGQLDTSEEALSGEGNGSGILAVNMREDPVTWKDWVIFEDDLVTDQNGRIVYADRRYYDFLHQYCDGHPIPPELEESEDAYAELMEQWQEAVDACEEAAVTGAGSFHHWECGSESTPSVEEAFEQSGCRKARDLAYENFINLNYSYTFRETSARDGYILHGPAGHPDDVPVEIITTPSSESGRAASWSTCSNADIVVSGYARNMISEEEEEPEDVEQMEHPSPFLLTIEAEELPAGARFLNWMFRVIGLPESFVRENDLTVKVEANVQTASWSNLATDSDTEELIYDIPPASASDAESESRTIAQETEKTTVRREQMQQGTPDGQPEAERGNPDQTAHHFIVYDHRVPGEIHFNKRDLDLEGGEEKAYDSYGDSQGDATLEGALYGLFAAESIYGPDTQRDESGEVTGGTGIIFDANDLVAVAATDRNGDGSFMAITQKPHSIYDYSAGQIQYTGKPYPQNLYVENIWKKEHYQEEHGRVYMDNETANGCCWIGRPLILGNYYIKELARSEGYELSIAGRDGKYTNVTDTDAKSEPVGEAWISGQLKHAVTFPGENDTYGNRENLLSLEVTSKDAWEGYQVVIDGIHGQADFYLDEAILKPVTVKVQTGGGWEPAAEAPFYQMAEFDGIWKRDQNGERIEDPEAVKKPLRITGTASLLKSYIPQGSARPSDMDRYSQPFVTDSSNISYIKYELEQMMRSLGMETPKKDGVYTTEETPVYDERMPVQILELEQVTTNQSVIEAILSYYEESGAFLYGGLQSVSQSGDKVYASIVVSAWPLNRFLYRQNAEGDITQVYRYQLNPAYGRYILREYTGDEIKGAEWIEGGQQKCRVTVSPDFIVNDDGTVENLEGFTSDLEQYLHYQKGETLYDYWYQNESGAWVGHEPVKRMVFVPIFREETVGEEHVNTSRIPVVESVEEVVDVKNSTFAYYDEPTGQYIIHVGARDMDLSGVKKTGFTIALPDGSTTVTQADMEGIGAGVSTAADFDREKGYIRSQRLIYNGGHCLREDGNTVENPLRVEERVIGQKIKVRKEITNEKARPGFRFKVYLRSNLQRLYRAEDGTVIWQDRNGNQVDIAAYQAGYPAAVQKIYTRVPHRVEVAKNSQSAAIANQTLYSCTEGLINEAPNKGYTAILENYEKFFDAIGTANTDRWDHQENREKPFNTWEEWDAGRDAWGGKVDTSTPDTSYKPFAHYLQGNNEINTGEEAKKNAMSSDAVRQFAITWYLEEEVRKLTGEYQVSQTYPDEIYDQALLQAIQKANHYLTPFFRYDLDSIYAIPWDGEPDGGLDRDLTTLSADIPSQSLENQHTYGISNYLPYGIYVIAEQQPHGYPLKQYKPDTPKEIVLPAVYEAGELAGVYTYRPEQSPEQMAADFQIRFYEEWSQTHVIRSRNADGDFKIYPYGLDLDQLSQENWKVTQDLYDPVKDYYNDPLVDQKEEGGHPESHYFADDRDYPMGYPLVNRYKKDEIEKRYHYGSISEQAVRQSERAGMEGELIAVEGSYGPMFVPRTVQEPVTAEDYQGKALAGYADIIFRNSFYTTRLRIEKMDDETGESILHDQAIFALYQAVREESATGNGRVQFYEAPAILTGSREFLEAMGAYDIRTKARDMMNPEELEHTIWYGTVPAGTPICRESDRIDVWTTKRNGAMEGESGEDTVFARQNTGYLESTELIGAGVYVLAEIKPPAGYVRSRPIAVEVYSDQVSYYQNGNRDSRVAAAIYEDARIYAGNTPVRLEVSKKGSVDQTITYRVSGRVEGSITELNGRYGLDNLELAYLPSGAYLGYGWFRGTAEVLAARAKAGEQVEFGYEKGVFAGYANITKTVETPEPEKTYVPGAKLTLYDAVEIRANGDGQDFAYDGLVVERDRSSNVQRMYVKEGYAGTRIEFEEKEGEAGHRICRRPDTDILFYDLGNLKVLETDRTGERYSYDWEGRRMKIVPGVTRSIFAIRNNRPVLELVSESGDFSDLVYDGQAKGFTSVGSDVRIYHLDAEGNRDGLSDPYTGMAYTTEAVTGKVLVWPVNVIKDRYGKVITRNKIKTFRIATIHAGTVREYVGGTYRSDGAGRFDKWMYPVLDRFGQVIYYRRSGETYEKSRPVYDRDDDFMYDRYHDGLRAFNQNAYLIKEESHIFDKGLLWDPTDNREEPLYMRLGDHYILENTWISGETTPNDPFDPVILQEQADVLLRLVPGVYILEEVSTPEGYVKALPVGVTVAEQREMQTAELENQKTRVEIIKLDAPMQYSHSEGKSGYSFGSLSGAKLSLYRAEKVYTTDLEAHPSGWYLKKKGVALSHWTTAEGPLWLEGVEPGLYLLEETQAPEGYIRNIIPLVIRATGEVQSFFMPDDHTKLEVYKYRHKDGRKEIMPNSSAAELSLYQAFTDADGVLQYREEDLVETWETDDCRRFTQVTDRALHEKWGMWKRLKSRLGFGERRYSGFQHDYESMYQEYGNGFDELHWYYADEEGNLKEGAARRLDAMEADHSGFVRQTWETREGEQIRILISPGQSHLFEYQYDHKKLDGNIVSYHTPEGGHRIDYLPWNTCDTYLLVETKTPEGYQTAEPKKILIRETEEVQVYAVENKPDPREPEPPVEETTPAETEPTTEPTSETVPETSLPETEPVTSEPGTTDPPEPSEPVPQPTEDEGGTEPEIEESEEKSLILGRISAKYEKDGRKASGRLPKAGDTSLLWIWIVMWTVSGAGLLVGIRRRQYDKRRRKGQNTSNLPLGSDDTEPDAGSEMSGGSSRDDIP